MSMSILRSMIAILAVILLNTNVALSDSVSSRLMIHRPSDLIVEGGYEHREALFGMPPYGGSIAQALYYSNSDLCDPTVDKTKGFPSRSKDSSGKMEPWQSPYILMVDRGNCTFVTKVRNAQRAGAAGVLIADNICQCSDEACGIATSNAPCEQKEPIMADDGSGADVSIPSFLMAKHDADKVKEAVKKDTYVQVEMSWSLPSPDDRVEYDLWTTPADPVSVEFFEKFKKFAVALGDSAYFTPHAYIIDGVAVNCNSEGGDNYCYNLCSNQGRYCALDPDSNVDAGVSGSDVVQESLRRLCIWDLYGKEDGVGRQWWDYVRVFNDRCRNKDYFKDEACIKDAYKAGSVDAKSVERCMADSGELDKDVSNNKFEVEIALQEQRGVIVIPTAFVNTVAIRGSLTVENVFGAICAGYAVGSAPDVCVKCGSCPNAEKCIDDGVCTAAAGGATISGDGVSTHTFATSMFLVVALFVGLGVWHYKRTQEQMRDQVRGILAEYMPLEDQDGVKTGSPLDFARGGSNASLIS